MELFARPEASGRPDRTSGRCNTKIECIYRLFHGRVLISSSDYYSTCQEVSRAPMDPFAGPEASGPTNRASGRCKTEEKCKLFPVFSHGRFGSVVNDITLMLRVKFS